MWKFLSDALLIVLCAGGQSVIAASARIDHDSLLICVPLRLRNAMRTRGVISNKKRRGLNET